MTGDLAPPEALTLQEVIASARDGLALLTDLPIDQVVSANPDGEGWRVVIDVLEVRARLGSNDLLATYELSLSRAGAVLRVERLHRYGREAAEVARS
ncbi:MAG: gas vesicle protein GvpO [Pikeienuella sp.]